MRWDGLITPGVLVALAVAISGGLYGYGVLNQQVDDLRSRVAGQAEADLRQEAEIRAYRSQAGAIHLELRDLSGALRAVQATQSEIYRAVVRKGKD